MGDRQGWPASREELLPASGLSILRSSRKQGQQGTQGCPAAPHSQGCSLGPNETLGEDNLVRRMGWLEAFGFGIAVT